MVRAVLPEISSFKISNDPFFTEKLEAIVGLYGLTLVELRLPFDPTALWKRSEF
jgi:hypothetical protein